MLNMALNAMRQVTSDELLVETLLAKILRIPALRGLDWDITCPELVELIIKDIVELMDDNDPFKELKANQNSKTMAIYPWLMGLVNKASDPFYTALNLAIYGNLIDIMMRDESPDLKKTVKEKIKSPISKGDFAIFRDKIRHCKLIIYFGDNSGEIVFDRLLIETMKSKYNVEIVFIVRSLPTLNDVTMEEAKMVGLHEITPVIENGMDGPVPGTIMARCSEKLTALVRDADFIISKGGGNYECLNEGKLDKDTSFLLMTKCKPICDHFKTDLDKPILKNIFEAAF
jgi:uncharacterized protein with ATP-grasp and redox domains